jgi:hypothetical protein
MVQSKQLVIAGSPRACGSKIFLHSHVYLAFVVRTRQKITILIKETTSHSVGHLRLSMLFNGRKRKVIGTSRAFGEAVKSRGTMLKTPFDTLFDRRMHIY